MMAMMEYEVHGAKVDSLPRDGSYYATDVRQTKGGVR